jgi:CheY-like chemotaxis protein
MMLNSQMTTSNDRHVAAMKRKSLSLLIIEDSESDVYLVQSLLQEIYPRISFNVTDAPRLVDAFKIVKRDKFDIILLDLNLLDIQGVASVAALHAEIPETPIIVYSGMDDPNLRKESLLCGAQYYLVKGKQTAASLKTVIDDVLAHQH